MLTVWCVWWRDPAAPDKYNAYCVQRLKKTVAENLSIPHRFLCITSEQVDGVDTIPPVNDLPGWWGKVNLFSWDVCDEHNLYLDLDVVVTGSLDDIIQKHGKASMAMPLNWAQSGHGGCQSSVMLWRKNYNTKQVYDLFDRKYVHWPPRQPWTFYGDQEWITHLRDTDRVQVNPMNPYWIRSYKYHCRQELPADTRIVVFHGDPKPAQVQEPWFQW